MAPTPFSATGRKGGTSILATNYAATVETGPAGAKLKVRLQLNAAGSVFAAVATIFVLIGMRTYKLCADFLSASFNASDANVLATLAAWLRRVQGVVVGLAARFKRDKFKDSHLAARLWRGLPLPWREAGTPTVFLQLVGRPDAASAWTTWMETSGVRKLYASDLCKNMLKLTDPRVQAQLRTLQAVRVETVAPPPPVRGRSWCLCCGEVSVAKRHGMVEILQVGGTQYLDGLRYCAPLVVRLPPDGGGFADNRLCTDCVAGCQKNRVAYVVDEALKPIGSLALSRSHRLDSIVTLPPNLDDDAMPLDALPAEEVAEAVARAVVHLVSTQKGGLFERLQQGRQTSDPAVQVRTSDALAHILGLLLLRPAIERHNRLASAVPLRQYRFKDFDMLENGMALLPRCLVLTLDAMTETRRQRTINFKLVSLVRESDDEAGSEESSDDEDGGDGGGGARNSLREKAAFALARRSYGYGFVTAILSGMSTAGQSANSSLRAYTTSMFNTMGLDNKGDFQMLNAIGLTLSYDTLLMLQHLGLRDVDQWLMALKLVPRNEFPGCILACYIDNFDVGLEHFIATIFFRISMKMTNPQWRAILKCIREGQTYRGMAATDFTAAQYATVAPHEKLLPPGVSSDDVLDRHGAAVFSLVAEGAVGGPDFEVLQPVPAHEAEAKEHYAATLAKIQALLRKSGQTLPEGVVRGFVERDPRLGGAEPLEVHVSKLDDDSATSGPACVRCVLSAVAKVPNGWPLFVVTDSQPHTPVTTAIITSRQHRKQLDQVILITGFLHAVDKAAVTSDHRLCKDASSIRAQLTAAGFTNEKMVDKMAEATSAAYIQPACEFKITRFLAELREYLDLFLLQNPAQVCTFLFNNEWACSCYMFPLTT